MNKISEEEYLAKSSVGIQFAKKFKLNALPRIVYYREQGDIWVIGKERKKEEVLLMINASRELTNGKCKGEKTGEQF